MSKSLPPDVRERVLLVVKRGNVVSPGVAAVGAKPARPGGAPPPRCVILAGEATEREAGQAGRRRA